MKTSLLHLWKQGLCIFFLFRTAALAQDVDFESHVFTTGSGFTMPYRFVQPPSRTLDKRYPLVLFLHGGGDVGTDNEMQLNWFPYCLVDSGARADHPCYILAPQCPSLDTGWSSFPYYPDVATPDQPPLAIATVLSLIDSLRASDSLSIDSNRIYVIGFSFGAEGTFDILTRKPGLFAAAIPISGIGDTAKVYLYKDVPLWIFHGNQDPINDVRYSRMIVAKLQSLGVQPRYTEYDMDHYIAFTAYAEPDLLPWLFAQTKLSPNKALRPDNGAKTDNGRYSALRKEGQIELSWYHSVAPDAAEIYTLNGKLLCRRRIPARNGPTLTLPIPCAHGALAVKLLKNNTTLYTALLPAGG